MSTTLETTIDNFRDEAMRAGFQPGRRLHVEIRYADESWEQKKKWLDELVARHPLPAEYANLTDEEALALANEAIAEYRAEQKHG